ncbi:substrate binding domain-containing protein [Paraburkholderia sp. EB58]|uniref:substrate binding domain-containing protein n=1 Tax=Paraburkholderia sp. EB58 TaxID=3035125 RepID=UPI003D2470EB
MRLHLMPALNGFLDTYPDLALDIVLDDRNVDLLEEGRRRRLADRNARRFKYAGTQARGGTSVVVGSPAYFERAGIPCTPDELSCRQFINYSQQGGGRVWTFRRDDTDSSVSLHGRLSVSALEAVRETVLAGMGIAVAPRLMFFLELKSGQVWTLLPDWLLPHASYGRSFPQAGRQEERRVLSSPLYRKHSDSQMFR